MHWFWQIRRCVYESAQSNGVPLRYKEDPEINNSIVRYDRSADKLVKDTLQSISSKHSAALWPLLRRISHLSADGVGPSWFLDRPAQYAISWSLKDDRSDYRCVSLYSQQKGYSSGYQARKYSSSIGCSKAVWFWVGSSQLWRLNASDILWDAGLRLPWNEGPWGVQLKHWLVEYRSAHILVAGGVSSL